MTNLAVLLVAGALMGESGGEPKAGLGAVADVICNRMIERKLDAVSVVLQRHQFCVFDRGTDPVWRRITRWEKVNSPRWRLCKKMAEEIIVLKWKTTTKWNHFYAPGAMRGKPAWHHDLKETKRIGKHLFGTI